MALAELIHDIDAAAARYEKAKAMNPTQLTSELANTVMPMLKGILEAVVQDLGVPLAAVTEDVATLADDLDAVLRRETDILQPETAGAIAEVFALGEGLAVELETLAATFDDIRRKRIADLVAAYRAGVTAVAETIDTITVVEEDDDEEDDGDGDEAADADGEGDDE